MVSDLIQKMVASLHVLPLSWLIEKYSLNLLTKKKVFWFYLKGNKNLISNRLKLRKNHFMPSSLLASQFDILEETKELIFVSIDQTEEELLDAIIKKLNDVKS